MRTKSLFKRETLLYLRQANQHANADCNQHLIQSDIESRIGSNQMQMEYYAFQVLFIYPCILDIEFDIKKIFDQILKNRFFAFSAYILLVQILHTFRQNFWVLVQNLIKICVFMHFFTDSVILNISDKTKN
jgi:hypothetical protein